MPARKKDRYKSLYDNVKELSDHWASGPKGHFELLGSGGWCNALVCMWGQAVLAKDTAVFYDRLNILTREYHPGSLMQDYLFFTRAVKVKDSLSGGRGRQELNSHAVKSRARNVAEYFN
ncbi:MAG: hypothetical protein GY750_20630 [Lentisphaerae bacterium]|nr:hypothetical protein [Lentisphaerota bacterium]MCP4103799.1 hypothetical protein [Lentisphaerota bacterium]